MNRIALSMASLLMAVVTNSSAMAATEQAGALNFVCEINGLMPNKGTGPTVYSPESGLVEFTVDVNQKAKENKDALGWSETKATLKGRNGHAFELSIGLDAFKGLTMTSLIKKNGKVAAKATVPFAGQPGSPTATSDLETAQASLLANCVAKP